MWLDEELFFWASEVHNSTSRADSRPARCLKAFAQSQIRINLQMAYFVQMCTMVAGVADLSPNKPHLIKETLPLEVPASLLQDHLQLEQDPGRQPTPRMPANAFKPPRNAGMAEAAQWGNILAKGPSRIYPHRCNSRFSCWDNATRFARCTALSSALQVVKCIMMRAFQRSCRGDCHSVVARNCTMTTNRNSCKIAQLPVLHWSPTKCGLFNPCLAAAESAPELELARSCHKNRKTSSELAAATVSCKKEMSLASAGSKAETATRTGDLAWILGPRSLKCSLIASANSGIGDLRTSIMAHLQTSDSGTYATFSW